MHRVQYTCCSFILFFIHNIKTLIIFLRLNPESEKVNRNRWAGNVMSYFERVIDCWMSLHLMNNASEQARTAHIINDSTLFQRRWKWHPEPAHTVHSCTITQWILVPGAAEWHPDSVFPPLCHLNRQDYCSCRRSNSDIQPGALCAIHMLEVSIRVL